MVKVVYKGDGFGMDTTSLRNNLPNGDLARIACVASKPERGNLKTLVGGGGQAEGD